MALFDKAPGNVDSEMEEGEIVDDLDDLSDISSEEEFLLRQRLQVLENYNNVLERKKAKDSSFEPGIHGKHAEDLLLDLSEISATDLDDSSANIAHKTGQIIVCRNAKHQKPLKSYHKPKRKKDLESFKLAKPKEYKKKIHRKKKIELKVISESSEESDDEYRNKRRKLANAVAVSRSNSDKTSLQDRLQKMLGGTADNVKHNLIEDKQLTPEKGIEVKDVACSPILEQQNKVTTKQTQDCCVLIDLCTDDDGGPEKSNVSPNPPSIDTVDTVVKEKIEDDSKKTSQVDSDEDLEQLRQRALKSKAMKPKIEQETAPESVPAKAIVLSEDEDSDTAELRLICLKSALLKKAIEMKQKQKLRKRLSQSSFTMQEDFLDEYKDLENIRETGNNTDIESVDMDIGSDTEEKGKEVSQNDAKVGTVEHLVNQHKENVQQHIKRKSIKDDELEEDEDLLRAKLLTSLSKNLPNLVDPNVIKTTEVETTPRENTPPVPKAKVPENRIVINLGESDSEGEHEATKNLTKMHIKLSEQVDFQQKLDMFLKSTRMEVEKTKLPDVLSPIPNTPEKFVPKTVIHLPKSEQIEYKNLVKKMSELEKIKEARQATMSLLNKTQVKDTLKPRNVSVDTSRIVALNMLEEQVAMSRKKIAEESSIMMKLKEEATKLTQKYKIVANELKNISTAITLNKKEQRTVQNRLTKIRLQHQRLLNSSLNKHSKINGNMLTMNRTGNLQKENNPVKEDYKNPQILKAVRVSVANDKTEEMFAPNSRLSVQVDVTSNKKTVSSFSNAVERVVEKNNSSENAENDSKHNTRLLAVEEDDSIRSKKEINVVEPRIESRITNEYESPLLSLEKVSWEADPNAILCPFEVGGNCKDPDCKYLHHKVLSQ